MNPRSSFFQLDLGLLLPVFVLILLGLSTLFSIQFGYFRSQLIFLFISLFFYFVFSHVDCKAIQLYAFPIYWISLVLLFVLLLLGIESRGAVRWIDVFGIRVQFSEILKPFLAVSLASFLSTRDKLSFKSFITLLGFLFPVTVLIYLQPDLGNAVLYLGVTVLTLIIVGYPFAWFILGVGGALAFSPFLFQFLHEYQRKRILTFFHPAKDPLGTSYNVIQSVIAVGSGMMFGKGISEATQSRLRFLPERHTDFIFATFSEGFGFLGGCILFITFSILMYNIYSIYKNSDDRFCKIYTASVFFVFLIPIFVNIGMNIGIVPIAGVALPFLSYGGSSLLSNFIILGILSAVKRNIRKADVLEIK